MSVGSRGDGDGGFVAVHIGVFVGVIGSSVARYGSEGEGVNVLVPGVALGSVGVAVGWNVGVGVGGMGVGDMGVGINEGVSVGGMDVGVGVDINEGVSVGGLGVGCMGVSVS